MKDSIVKKWVQERKVLDRVLSQGLFDIDFYNQQCEINYSEVEGLRHYLKTGWLENKNPAQSFSTEKYMKYNPDVAGANICPLTHYVLHGQREGRKIFECNEITSKKPGVYKISRYQFPVTVAGTETDLAECINDNGLFLLSASKTRRKSRIEVAKSYFYDETVMAVVFADESVLKPGVYTADDFASSVTDLNSFVIIRDSCVLRSRKEVLMSHPEIWYSDYAFTNFLFQTIVCGRICVVSEVGINCERTSQADRDNQIARFKYLVKNYDFEPNKIVDYFNMLCSGEKTNLQAFQRDLLQQLNQVNRRILISIYAFSNGGGEMQPIRLANELKKQGFPVAVHIYNVDESGIAIRKCLRFDIPVFYTDDEAAFSEEIRALRMDVVNTQHCSCQVLACGAYNAELNHVATSHGMFDTMQEQELKYLFSKIFCGKVDYWTYVAKKNLIPFMEEKKYDVARFCEIPNGIEIPKSIQAVDLREFGIAEDSFVCCLVSRAIREKGWAEAIEAVRIARLRCNKDIHLILVGEGPVYEEIKENHPYFVHPVGLQNNVLSWFAAADVCLLPTYYSCESFPLTIVEALQCEKPVIATDIGEVANMISDGQQKAGELLTLKDGRVDIEEIVSKIVFLVKNEQVRENYSAIAAKIKERFDIAKTVQHYLDVYEAKPTRHYNHFHAAIARMKMVYMSEYEPDLCPKVSVIVPNYNYADLLPRRLESIYGQTYKNIEVILLDDVSTDGSREVLLNYAQKHKVNTITAFNDVNRGVFSQWKKGMSLASGELCWIAEADDWCEDTFLECLVPMMLEHDVRIAYAKYNFAEDERHVQNGGYENYVSALDAEKWKTSYIEDAEAEVHVALGKRNTLVNVSGLIFARPVNVEKLCCQEWQDMRICGDWMLYLQLLKGGRIAYCSDVNSYFRISPSQSSAGSSTYVKELYYIEHAQVMLFLQKYYSYADTELEITRSFIQNHCDALAISANRKKKLMKCLDDTIAEHRLAIHDSHIEFAQLPTFFVRVAYESDANDPLAFDKCGRNSGNLVFVDAAKRQLRFVKEIDFCQTMCSEYYARSIICLSNSISFTRGNDRAFMHDLDNYANNFGGQLTIFGLGSQSCFPGQEPKDLVGMLGFYKLSVLRKLAEKSHTIGIRGQYTADCLSVMGVHNHEIIGCPSIYIQKSYEHMRVKKPSAQNLLVNFTRNVPTASYRSWEFKLMQLGAEYNAAWCQQTLAEYPADLIAAGKLDRKIESWLNKRGKIFYKCDEWSKWLRDSNFTLSLGTRFHGNMMAFQNGIPALWVDHDSRTRELLDYLHLPYVDCDEIEHMVSIQELVKKCDYTEFLENYPAIRQRYICFLHDNAISLRDEMC